MALMWFILITVKLSLNAFQLLLKSLSSKSSHFKEYVLNLKLKANKKAAAEEVQSDLTLWVFFPPDSLV